MACGALPGKMMRDGTQCHIALNGGYVILPKAPVEKLIREAGARRVSDGAAVELAEVLEKIGTDISVRALRLAKHAGRKTITAADIKLAKP